MVSSTAFNPVKAEKNGVRARRVIWSTESLELGLQALEQGKKLIANPFYENKTKLLKGDLVFQRTPEEISEWKKCARDIIYFVEKYCKLMTPTGVKHVLLRDYQKRYLRHLEKSQLSIYLACRQCGKCVDFTTLVDVKAQFDDPIQKKLSEYYHKKEDYYSIPMFELYNLFNQNKNWKIKYNLYKIIWGNKNNTLITKGLYKLISCLDRSNRTTRKLVRSHLVDQYNISVRTESGWRPISHIHETRPFEQYVIKTDKTTLICADEHIVYVNGEPIFVRDLHPGDVLNGYPTDHTVISINVNYNRVSMCDVSVMSEDHTYYTNGINSHNTTTSAIFMLHYILFNVDKNALVLGNKFKTAKEILSKAKQIFQELPYFLKPGIYKWNEAEIVLDNGCRLMAEATTINSGISYTFHCVLADEFAHVAPNILDKFYNNLFPTITAGKARFMITSTQNGYNLFCRLYKAAEAGENDYKSFVTDWWEVPEWNPETQTWEKRDEEWHQRQVANYGSEEAFNKQFGTNFDVSANTLISQRIIGKFKQSLCEFINMDLPGVLFSNNWFWHPDYVPSEQLRRDYIVITCDLAEGGGGDYTTFMIHRMVVPGSDRLECIGYFHANTLDREQCALSLLQLLSMYCNPDCILLSFEKNTYGDLFMKSISDILNKFPFIAEKIDYSCFVKYKTSSTSNSYTYGIKITPGNKSETCLLYKDDYEKDMIRNESLQYMIELNNFTDDGTGHYRASFGHDDMVMASIQVEFVKQTLQYKIMRDTYDSTLGMTAGPEQDINWYSNEYMEDIGPSYVSGQTFYDLNSQPSDSNILNRFK